MCRIHEIRWNVHCTGLWFHRPLLSTWLWMTCFVWSVFTVLLKRLGFWPLSVVYHMHLPMFFVQLNPSWTCWTTNKREVSQWIFPANMCVFKSHCWPISKTHMVFREIFSLQSSLLIKVKLSLTNYYWFPSVHFKPQWKYRFGNPSQPRQKPIYKLINYYKLYS